MHLSSHKSDTFFYHSGLEINPRLANSQNASDFDKLQVRKNIQTFAS